MLSGPQDLLHLILSRRDWIYETHTGWKEKFSLKSRDGIEMLGWVENSSCLSFRVDWSKTGVEKREFKKCEGSVVTLPSSIRWISSLETSLPVEGNRGFRFFQKLLGVLALEAFNIAISCWHVTRFWRHSIRMMSEWQNLHHSLSKVVCRNFFALWLIKHWEICMASGKWRSNFLRGVRKPK